MKIIEKIKIHNFRRFKDFTVEFDDKINLLIGDNEAGKSTILSAIDFVLGGSRNKIESIGLDSLFNYEVIQEFLNSDKKYNSLPILFIEIYLNEQNSPDLNGNYNSNRVYSDGLILCCEPNDSLSKEINEILEQPESNFPFEFYNISFTTFANQAYSGYRRFLRHILIDNTQISNEYATRQYIKAIYNSTVQNAEKNKHQNEYRKSKFNFRENILTNINNRLSNYAFSIKTNSKSNLETDLTITENNIDIENKGKGRQCFIKTEFALRKNETELDIVLLEEPENHLSHINMKKLINKISDSDDKQLIIATHNNLVSTRLDLRKSILINSNSQKPVLLKDLTLSTSKFFMKAPDNNILEFILSKKVILVEGNAEFILLNLFFEKIAGNKPEYFDVHIISVGGINFKRYLEISKLLNIKTAVITDNDADYQSKCIDYYADFSDDNIIIFFEKNNEKRTFEIILYEDNKTICDELFGEGRRTLTVQEYMLKNKADVAFELLDKKMERIIVPNYIKKAIEWIKE